MVHYGVQTTTIHFTPANQAYEDAGVWGAHCPFSTSFNFFLASGQS